MTGCRAIFKTSGPVVIYPSSGTGAWEAAIVNTLSPGDKVLMVETGHFATLWRQMAGRWGLEVDFIPGDWRHGVDPAAIEAKLAEDRSRAIKAVMVVHNETSTGVTSRIAEIRKAIDAAGHPALLLVDTISSLGSADYRHDEWGVDVTVSCSQKGLMLPPGLGFTAMSEKALAASKTNKMPRSYWDWQEMLKPNAEWLLPVYAGDQPALRAVRSHHDADGGRTRSGFRPPPASRRGNARGSARMGPRNSLPRPCRIFAGAHRGADAARS